MAITVIKPQEMGYNFGGELGQSTGRGLKKIVDSLIQKKQREVQQHTLLNAGYSPEDAAAIQSGFSPEQIKLMQILSSGRSQPGSQGAENALASREQPQGAEQPNEMASLFGGQGQQPSQPGIEGMESQQPLTTAQKI